MSIIGIGTDLVDIRRVADLLRRHPERFPQRILTTAEVTHWRLRGNDAAWLAKRFAAKEAAAKALGTGIGGRVSFQDLVIGTSTGGAPTLTLRGGARAVAERAGVNAAHVSLSDESQHALAFVVLENIS